MEYNSQNLTSCVGRVFDQAEQQATEKLLSELVFRRAELNVADIVVPVCFHVIHLGEPVGVGTNISNEQIYSAINALNKDYSKEIDSRGDGSGAASLLRFQLMNKDDKGQFSTGIYRVNGAELDAEYAASGIRANGTIGLHEAVVKNWSRQNNQHAYNVWIVSEINGNDGGSGVQGFAYYPTVNMVDGTVILFNAIGVKPDGVAVNFPLKAYTKLNKTLTHEIGHAFALPHTFTSSSCVYSEPLLQVNNYMNYGNEGLKTMFAPCQVDRMHLVADFSRGALAQSSALSNLHLLDADAILDIVAPFDVQGPAEKQSIRVKVVNTSSDPISKIEFSYAAGSVSGTYTWYGAIAPQGPLGFDEITIAKVPIASSVQLSVSILSINNNAKSITAQKAITVPTGKPYTVELCRDNLSGQISWDITQAITGAVLYSSPSYPNFQDGVIDSHPCALPDGDFIFTVRDLQPGFVSEGAYVKLMDGNKNVLIDITETTGEDFIPFTVGNKPTDLNGDGVVNILDVSEFMKHFGTHAGDANYNPKCDFNNDGKIDILDLTYLTKNFGK